MAAGKSKQAATPSTRSGKPKRRASKRDSMETLGEAGMLEYVKTGGKCSRQRCSNDAPKLRIGHKWLRMPCKSHAAKQEEEWREEDRAARSALMLTRSGMTDRMRGWSFDTYAQTLKDSEA